MYIPYPVRDVFRSILFNRRGAEQQTRDIEPMLDYCLANVVDGGPTMIQNWHNVSCLVGGYGGLRASDSDLT